MGKQWKQWEISLGPKITVDGDCSHEIKRCLLLGRKAMTNLDSILKSRYITLLTKVHLVKGMVFPVVVYGCESWTIKKAECQRIDAFELWCWRRLLKGSWTTTRSNQSILKEISPEYSLKWLMPKRKLQYFGCLMWRKDPDAGKDWRQEEKGMTEHEMVGWYHRLDGREFDQAVGVGDGQGSLACCSPWGCKESDNWLTKLNWTSGHVSAFAFRRSYLFIHLCSFLFIVWSVSPELSLSHPASFRLQDPRTLPSFLERNPPWHSKLLFAIRAP